MSEPPRDPRTASLQFVGNATTVLRLGPFTLLTDPNFVRRGERLHLGYGLVTKRLRDPAITVDELPELDAVVLSHLHADHWDGVAERALDRSLPVLTTTAAAKALRGRGFRAAEGLQVWQTVELRDGDHVLRVTAVPGRHGPAGVARLLPPVMGTVLELEREGSCQLRMYVSGDTMPIPELRQVAERYPELDVMVVHLGGTKVFGLVTVTMTGEQGAELTDLLRPSRAVPVHMDDYTVMTSGLEDYLAAARQRGVVDRVLSVQRGQEVDLPTRLRG
jgi:L-ascorbate metabolism protein UlaG (beta-lactamase superfamily)